jgi:tryptophanyl-tRNA synthetase
VRRTDPGDPKDCPAFNLHRIYCTAEEIDYVSKGCRTAGIGCLDCKKVMIKHVVEQLEPIQQRRSELEKRPDAVAAVLEDGNAKARAVASKTMAEVRAAVGLE